jgi:membrane protein
LIIAHRVLPNKKMSLRQIAPGIALTYAAWMVFALAFSSYLGRFALNYVSTYAGLASVMIAIVFLYALAAIFIFGGEFNAALRRARHRERPVEQKTEAEMTLIKKSGTEAPPLKKTEP